MKFNPSAWIRIPAEHYPQKVGVQYAGRSFSYREVNERANRLAWGLMGMGLGRGSRVATLQLNCHQSFELFVGMWKAGIVMIPLNTRDSTAEHIRVLMDSQAEALVFGAEFAGQVDEMRGAFKGLRLVCHGLRDGSFQDYEALVAQSDPREPDIELDDEEVYKIHYTSGTTGTPRGVVMSYRNRKEQVANVFTNADHLISAEDVFLHVAPLTHAAGYYSTPYYLKGARHVVLNRFDPETVLRTIETERVTCTLLVPTMIVMLLEEEGIGGYDLGSLRRVFYGTAPITTEKLRKAISLFGPIFRQNYGLTEAVQPLARFTPDEHASALEAGQQGRLASTGKRAIGVEIRIVDDDGEDVRPGDVGEILIRGPHVSPGYVNSPDLTRETYAGGWLHTGDLGRFDDDGYLYIVDRKKDMIISGGFNIYSREVELFLESHPAVLESAVIGHPDEKWGEVCKACIVLKEGHGELRPEALVDHCKERGLATYKAPKIVAFVDALPKNENRKIDKRELRRMSERGDSALRGMAVKRTQSPGPMKP